MSLYMCAIYGLSAMHMHAQNHSMLLDSSMSIDGCLPCAGLSHVPSKTILTTVACSHSCLLVNWQLKPICIWSRQIACTSTRATWHFACLNSSCQACCVRCPVSQHNNQVLKVELRGLLLEACMCIAAATNSQTVEICKLGKCSKSGASWPDGGCTFHLPYSLGQAL